MSKKLVAGFIMVGIPTLWLLVAAIVSLAMIPPRVFSYGPEYNREVHSHMENAYYASTPELMKSELQLAVKGMQNLGLKPSYYSDLRPWKQNAAHRMDYQYAHMQAIIERADDVIKWRESQGHSAQGSQQNDVYGQKMDAVRAFVREGGWSDNLAEDTYYTHHHPFYAGWYQFFGVAALGWLGTAIFLGIPGGILLEKES